MNPKEFITWLNAQSISGTGVAGSSLLVDPFRDAMLILNVTQVPQTTPTLYIEAETSWDNSAWFFLAALTDKLTPGSLTRTTAPTDEHCIKAVGSQPFRLLNMAKYIRLNVKTFTGSGTPSTFTVTALLSLYR